MNITAQGQLLPDEVNEAAAEAVASLGHQPPAGPAIKSGADGGVEPARLAALEPKSSASASSATSARRAALGGGRGPVHRRAGRVDTGGAPCHKPAFPRTSRRQKICSGPKIMSKADPMQLTERRSEGLLRVYDVVVPAAELQQKLNAKIAEVQPRVKLNGFRPGKVPVSHIRKVYGPSMMQDIINETVQNSTKEGLEKVNARPASEPTLDLKSDINQVVAGNPDLSFELSLEIMHFRPADLKAIAITRPVSEPTDDQVEEERARSLNTARL